MGNQAWFLVTTLVLYAYLARYFGPSDFGEWRVAITLLAWVELFVDSGVNRMAAKMAAEGHIERKGSYVRVYVVQAGFAFFVLAAMLVLSWPIGRLMSDSSLAALLRIAAVDIPFYAGFSLARSILIAKNRLPRWALGMFVYPLARLFAIAALVAGGYGLVGALLGNAVASLVGFAVSIVPFKATMTERRSTRRLYTHAVWASFPFLLIGMLTSLPASLDLWVLKAFLGRSPGTGFYAAAGAFAEVPTFLFVGLHSVLFPSLAQVTAEGDSVQASRYSVQAMRLALVVTLFGVAVTVTTGRQLLSLVYSPSFAPAFVPLILLMLAAVSRTVARTCSEIMLARGRSRETIALFAGLVVIEGLLLLLLIPRLGMVGAALSALLASSVVALVSTLRLGELVGLRPFVTLARASAAALGAGILLAMLPIPDRALPVAYAIGGLAYVGILFGLQEAKREDVASVARALPFGLGRELWTRQ
ncbi:MAG: hypothetical protein C4521_09145 [Actinobacteria bacterium]|nr:MAG: hypothetical protein C4521_09145 [Actinomycetota bacterium]